MKFFSSLIFFLSITMVITTAVSILDRVPARVDQYSTGSDYNQLFNKFGHKAVDFLKCMGDDFIENCLDDTNRCFTATNVLYCLELMECRGKGTGDCIHFLKQYTDVSDYKNLTKKFLGGEEFLTCMQPEFVQKCWTPTDKCMSAPNETSVLNCLEAINCGGKNGTECIHHLRQYHDFPKLFIRFGAQLALDYLKCAGPQFIDHCAAETDKCFTSPNVLECLRSVKCGGIDAEKCAQILPKDTDASDYVKLADKYGAQSAMNYVHCMGSDFIKKCLEPTNKCVTATNSTDCLRTLQCEKGDGKYCVHFLHK